jgi:hypothetical protein
MSEQEIKERIEDEVSTLLLGMRIAAKEDAERSLSDEGAEALRMIEHVARNTELTLSEAWVEAGATAVMLEQDRMALMAYLARVTLIQKTALSRQGRC